MSHSHTDGSGCHAVGPSNSSEWNKHSHTDGGARDHTTNFMIRGRPTLPLEPQPSSIKGWPMIGFIIPTFGLWWYVIHHRCLPHRHWQAPSSPLSWRRCAQSSSAAPTAPWHSCLCRSPSADRSQPSPDWKAISPCLYCSAPGGGFTQSERTTMRDHPNSKQHHVDKHKVNSTTICHDTFQSVFNELLMEVAIWFVQKGNFLRVICKWHLNQHSKS